MIKTYRPPKAYTIFRRQRHWKKFGFVLTWLVCWKISTRSVCWGGLDMLQLTKKAIVNSFIKLLNEKPLDKITVKNIAEDCGINRNTFYYHFRIILYKSTTWSGWRLKDKYMDLACRSHFRYQLQSFAVVAAVMKNHCGTYLKWLPTHSEKNVNFSIKRRKLFLWRFHLFL